MMGPTLMLMELSSSVLAPLDLVDERCRLLVVGINPSPWNVRTGAPFSRPGNRFWPALYQAGMTPHLVDASDGLDAVQRELVLALGLGVTNLVPRPTAKASELTREELREGPARVAAVVAAMRPQVVAFAGVTAYRTAYGRPRARTGRQEETVAGVETWIVPNPSGLNAHETVASLAAAYAEVARAAGMRCHPVA